MRPALPRPPQGGGGALPAARRRRARGWASGAKALADPTRLAIAVALTTPGWRACATWRGSSAATRSSSLITSAQLRAAGLARSERDGKMVMYELTDRGRALLAASRRGGERVSAPSSCRPPPSRDRSRRSRASATRELARRVRLLSWLSLAWMTIEGVVAIAAGHRRRLDRADRLRPRLRDRGPRERDHHLALHRHAGASRTPPSSARRSSSPIQFFILAPYVGFEATAALIAGERPGRVVGRHRPGGRLGDPHADARHRQAAPRRPDGLRRDRGRGPPEHALRLPRRRAAVGLLGNALVGAWWLDPIVGLLIAGVAVREGSRPGAARAAA